MRRFTEHPAAVGESYLQHMRAAAGFGARLLTGGLACLVHAVCPWLCERYASRTVAALYDKMRSRNPELAGVRRDARPAAPGVPAAAANRA